MLLFSLYAGCCVPNKKRNKFYVFDLNVFSSSYRTLRFRHFTPEKQATLSQLSCLYCFGHNNYDKVLQPHAVGVIKRKSAFIYKYHTMHSQEINTKYCTEDYLQQYSFNDKLNYLHSRHFITTMSLAQNKGYN